MVLILHWYYIFLSFLFSTLSTLVPRLSMCRWLTLRLITLNDTPPPARTHTHTHTHASTLGRTSLDEGPARRRVLYLTKFTRDTSILQVGFEPAIPAREPLWTHSLDRAAVGIGIAHCLRCISWMWHCGIWFSFLLKRVAVLVIVLIDCRYRHQCKNNTTVRISVV
jgi:hypothetical protein